MSYKSQFLKNNVMKVVGGNGGGTIGAAPGKRGSSGVPSGLPAPLNAKLLGHGNAHDRKANNKGSRSKLAGGS